MQIGRGFCGSDPDTVDMKFQHTRQIRGADTEYIPMFVKYLTYSDKQQLGECVLILCIDARKHGTYLHPVRNRVQRFCVGGLQEYQLPPPPPPTKQ
jgi:hypothetical protein